MKKKIIIAGVILITVCIIAFLVKGSNEGLEVETARVSKGDIEEYVEETGSLMLEEETVIYSTAAGKVVEVPRKAGETVNEGDVLVRLDNGDLLLQIKALEAQKLLITAKYDEAKSESDPEELNKLNAQVRSAEASYEEAKRGMDNNRALYEAGAVSLDIYKSSITKFAQAEASLETAKSSLSAVEKGISANVRKQYEAQLAEIKARIEQLREKDTAMVVKSPIAGMIMDSDIEEGSVVQLGSKLLEIGGAKGFYLESDVLIEDVTGIKVGSPVIIEDEDLGIRDMKGVVRKIYPKAFSKMSDLGIEQKRVKVEIELKVPVEGLRPGYDMTVMIVTRSSNNTHLIPEKAVFNYNGKEHVFVNEGGKALLRPIRKGLESNEQVEVLEGLNEGEEVILSPDDALEEGTRIVVKET